MEKTTINLFNNTLSLDLMEFVKELKNNYTKNFRLEKITKLIYLLSNKNLDKVKLFSNNFDSLDLNKIDLENIFEENINEKDLKNYFSINGKFYLKLIKIVLEFPKKEFDYENLENLLNNENKYISNHLELIENKLNSLKNTNHLTLLASTGAGKTYGVIELFKKSNYKKLIFFSPLSKLNKQTFYNAKKSNEFETFIAIGKENRLKQLDEKDFDFIIDDTNFLEVLTSDKKTFICADNFYYRYFFKNGKLKKQFENSKDVLIVVDEYDKVYSNLIKLNNNDSDGGEIEKNNRYNIFNCAISNFKYLFLTATPVLKENKITATNVIDFRTLKTNVKNLHLLNKKDFNSKLLEVVKTGDSLGYYVQNAKNLENFKKEFKKYYRTKNFRVDGLEKFNNYNIAINHNNIKVNKEIKDEVKLFDFIVENKNIKEKFCLLFTSCISAGYSIEKDVKNLFLDVSTLTNENDLIQLIGRFRGSIDNLYITIKEKENKVITEDFSISNGVFTMQENQLQNTNINLIKLNNNIDSGFKLEKDLKEFLSSHKFIFEKIKDKGEIKEIAKIKKDKILLKDFILDYAIENNLENFNLNDLLFFGFSKKDFTNLAKYENKIISNFTITKDDLITSIENKYPLDFKNAKLIELIENTLNKNFTTGEYYSLTSDIKKIFKESKIINFVKDYYFKHYRKLNLYKLVRNKLDLSINENLTFTGNLNKYITCNVNYLDNLLPIFISVKNSNIIRNNLENQGYTTKIINNNIFGIYTKNLKNQITTVNSEIIKNDNKYFGNFNENVFIDYLKKSKIISIDIETKSKENIFESVIDLDKKFLNKMGKQRNFQPHYSYISNINFYSENGFIGFTLDKNNYIDILIKIANLIKNKKLIFHNAVMEFNYFKHINILEILINNKNIFEDTLLLFKSIMINKSYSLKELSFNFANDLYIEKGNFYDLNYMFKDVYYTYNLFLYFHKHCKDFYNKIKFIYKNDLYYITHIKSNPIAVNENIFINEFEKCYELLKHYEKTIEVYKTPQKLIKFYNENYNIKLINTQKKYLKKVLKNEIESINIKDNQKNEILNFLDFKKVQKHLTDLKIISIKNLFISYNKVKTGRWSTNSPNLQGFSKSNFKINNIEFLSIKKLLLNRFEMDFSQQEIAVEGSVYNNQIKKDIVNKNLDLHSLTASQLFNLEYDFIVKNKEVKEVGEKRQIAKTFNFQIGYGSGVNGLYKSLKEINKNITLEDTQKYYDSFYENNKISKNCKNESLEINLSKYSNFTIENRFGRVRFYINFLDKGFLGNQILNYNIQSSSADLTTLCAVECMKAGLKVNSTVHDALYFETLEDAIKGKEIMLKVARKYFKDITGWKVE